MELHAALMPVLEILRAQGVVACAPARRFHASDSLLEFLKGL